MFAKLVNRFKSLLSYILTSRVERRLDNLEKSNAEMMQLLKTIKFQAATSLREQDAAAQKLDTILRLCGAERDQDQNSILARFERETARINEQKSKN